MPRQYVMSGLLAPHDEAAVNLWLMKADLKDVKAKRKLAEQRATATLDKEIEGLNLGIADLTQRLIVYKQDLNGDGPLAVAVPADFDDVAVTKRGKQTVILIELRETIKNHAKRVEIEDDPDPIVKTALKMTEHSVTPRLVPDEPEVREEEPPAPPWDGTPAGAPVAQPASDIAGAITMPSTDYVEIPDCATPGCGHERSRHGYGANEVCGVRRCVCRTYRLPGPAA